MARKILILSANPRTTSRLRLDEEVREIDEGLYRAKHRDRFELVQKWAVRPRDIHRAMLESNPHIVHFAGHGAGEEGLIFEDDTGQPKFVTGEALAGLFELFADQVECVVLNSCHSQVQAKAIAQHIQYVIVMQQAISDKAAIAFAVGFYDALGAGRPLEFAYKLGCNAVIRQGIPEHLTPILISTNKPKPISEERSLVPQAEYELLVKDILQSRLIKDIPGKDLEVRHNACYTGKSGYEHQIGVSAEMRIAGVKFLILVDCKNHSKLVEASEVLEFTSRIEDIGAQKGIIVTTRGFQSGAIQLARAKGIALIIACDLKWETCLESGARDIGLRQNFIYKGLRLLHRATKLDKKRLSVLYTQSAERRRGVIVYRFNSATNLDFLKEATYAYIFVTNSAINGDVEINQITKQFRLENDQFFVLLREGIFSFIAISNVYTVGLCFADKALVLGIPGSTMLWSWLALPLPDSNVVRVFNEFIKFFEFLPKGDLKQAFQLLRQIEKFDIQRNKIWWEFENFNSQNWEWKEIANWGWQEIVYALETPEYFDKILKLAQKGEIYERELDRLIIMVIERGEDDQAIALAHCIKSKLTNQKRALTLSTIASRIAKTGNLVKAANLFGESLQIFSQEDRGVAANQASEDFLRIKSRGLSPQDKVFVEIVSLATEANLIAQAIQSIKSESLQAKILARITRIASS